jgi:ubiquitin-protein ligase
VTSVCSEWHCNLTPDEGPYRATAFHLVLTFPADYPNNPPDVRVCTYLSHPVRKHVHTF